MVLSQVDRMSAVILAKTIANTHSLLDMKGDLAAYIRRLYKYRLFTVGEISEIAGVSEYMVHQAIYGEEEFRARSGVKPRHLDHLIRMVGSHSFARLHTKSLIDDGATFSALSRVTGISESSLRRYAREES